MKTETKRLLKYLSIVLFITGLLSILVLMDSPKTRRFDGVTILKTTDNFKVEVPWGVLYCNSVIPYSYYGNDSVIPYRFGLNVQKKNIQYTMDTLIQNIVGTSDALTLLDERIHVKISLTLNSTWLGIVGVEKSFISGILVWKDMSGKNRDIWVELMAKKK